MKFFKNQIYAYFPPYFRSKSKIIITYNINLLVKQQFLNICYFSTGSGSLSVFPFPKITGSGSGSKRLLCRNSHFAASTYFGRCNYLGLVLYIISAFRVGGYYLGELLSKIMKVIKIGKMFLLLSSTGH